MTAHTMKTLPHVSHLRLYYCINLQTETASHTIIQKHLQIPMIHPFTTTSQYNHMYSIYSLKTNIYSYNHNKPITKPYNIIISCSNISLFGKAVVNPLTTPQKIFGGTLPYGTSVPKPPALARRDAT